MKIVQLTTENVKRIRVASITPDGALVVVGGRNAQGKSSLLDSIEILLSGGKSIPNDPIRHGAGKATVFADIGDYTVERTITHRGGGGLVIKDKDGKKLTSPQKILDSLCTKIAFEPASFLRMKPADQDAMLRKAVGVDTTELDADRQVIYDRRTELNRAVAQAQAKFDGMVEHQDARDEEVSVAQLSAEITKANETIKANATKRLPVEEAKRDLLTAERESEILRLELERLQARVAANLTEVESLRVELATREAQAATLEDPDVQALLVQLETVEDVNRKVRENRARLEAKQELERAKASAQECTDTIEVIDLKKQKLLEEAKFPVEGLAFNELGPTLDGVPLEQASQAQLIRVSVAVGLAQNPQLRVLLVRDGSLMDSDSLALLAKLAEENDAQIWVEKVAESNVGCSVFIEDGSVIEGEAAAE